MEPLAGVVAAGTAAAVEGAAVTGVATAGATAGAAAAEGALGVAAGAVESSIQTATETAAQALESQASALNEGIAQSAESALDAGGADAALTSIGNANLPGEISSSPEGASSQSITTNAPGLSSENEGLISNSAGTGVAEKNPTEVIPFSPTENPAVPENNVDATAQTAEPQAPLNETQTSPDTGSSATEDSSANQDDSQNGKSTEFENATGEKVLVPDEVLSSKEYQEELNQVREEAARKGEAVSEEELNERAIKKHNEKKAEEDAKKMKEMEKKMKEIIEQNKKLLANQEALLARLDAIEKYMQGDGTEEERRKTYARTIAEIAAANTAQAIIEKTKTATTSVSG